MTNVCPGLRYTICSIYRVSTDIEYQVVAHGGHGVTMVCPGLLQPSCPLTIGFGLWTLALGTHQHCPCPPPSTSTSPSIYSISSASQILILCHCPHPHRQPLLLSTILGTLPQKKTGFFGNFSQVSGPPPPPLLGTPVSKKRGLFCILGP